MSRVAILVLSVPLLVVAAPAVKPTAVYYHPTKVGDKRLYEFRTGDTATDLTDEVTQVEIKDGRFLVTTSRGAAGSTVEVSADGLVQRTLGDKPLVPPAPMLRLPVKAGDAWSWEGSIPGLKTTFTMVGLEDVEVPAGKFRAVRVRQESVRDGKENVSTTYWYAPEVGLVKLVSKSATGAEQTQVLKSFKPAK